MKPENLKSPFSWPERKILIQDRILYVPGNYSNYDEFSFPGWSHENIFGNDHSVSIEYCSGNGTWISDKAQANPHINWVAVERKFARVRKIWSKIKNLNLNNLFVVCGEAFNVTKLYFPSHSIQEIYINFPDPWPKNRHAKNRLIQPLFIQEMARTLHQNGQFTLVTDDANYSEELIRMMQETSQFESTLSSPYFKTDWNQYGTSFFEELWREKGKEIRYHHYKKRV